MKKYFIIGGILLALAGTTFFIVKKRKDNDVSEEEDTDETENNEENKKNDSTPTPTPTKTTSTKKIEIGSIVSAKNQDGINIRRGQSTDATILFRDAKGRLGRVEEIVDEVNADGKKGNYKWCRILLDNPITYEGYKYPIGYCRIDVLKLT